MIKTLEERKFVNEEKISRYLKCSMCLGVFNVPVRTKCEYLLFLVQSFILSIVHLSMDGIIKNMSYM